MIDFWLSNSMTTNECFYENAITLMLVTTEHKFYNNKKKCYGDYWGKINKSFHKCIEGDCMIHSKNLALKDDITYLLI